MSTLNINLNDVQPLDTILTGLSALGYSGNEGLFIKVNATADGFEFAAAGGGGGGGNTFADNVFQIFDNTDNTKKLAFQASGITTGTTRTLTIPNASGTIALTSDLTSYVPYTGATQDVDLDNNGLDAKFIKIKGTGGNGHLNFKHQSSGSTAGGSESVIYADSVGNPKWKNDGNSVQNVMLENAAITGATKTKITYDAKGLVTAGTDATTADIAASTNKNYVTDAQLTVIGNTSGTNSGNQTLANTSDSTSHTVTLSATGGSVQLVEGSGITLTTTGTSADGIITIASSGGGGTVTDVAALTLGTTGTDLSSTVANGTTTPVITLNVPTASATNRGALSSADWTTFNNKAPSSGIDATAIADGSVTSTEFQYINTLTSNAQTQIDTKSAKLITTNRQTASYTLVIGDADKLVEMNVGSANNLTIPLNSSVAFATGTQILLAQYGAGQTTVVATSGVTIRSSGAKLKLNAQYSGATLIKIATDEWYLFGDIAA